MLYHVMLSGLQQPIRHSIFVLLHVWACVFLCCSFVFELVLFSAFMLSVVPPVQEFWLDGTYVLLRGLAVYFVFYSGICVNANPSWLQDGLRWNCHS